MSLKNLKKRGFTLIELMIVVAIIGILAAVAIPKFADLVTRSKEASVKGNLGAVRSAVSIYYSDTEGDHPTNLFGALTNVYLPRVAGTLSLGRFSVPRHGANHGHTTLLWANASSFTAVEQVAGTLSVADGTEPIQYVNSGVALGDLMIDCNEDDTKGFGWSTF